MTSERTSSVATGKPKGEIGQGQDVLHPVARKRRGIEASRSLTRDLDARTQRHLERVRSRALYLRQLETTCGEWVAGNVEQSAGQSDGYGGASAFITLTQDTAKQRGQVRVSKRETREAYEARKSNEAPRTTSGKSHHGRGYDAVRMEQLVRRWFNRFVRRHNGRDSHRRAGALVAIEQHKSGVLHAHVAVWGLEPFERFTDLIPAVEDAWSFCRTRDPRTGQPIPDEKQRSELRGFTQVDPLGNGRDGYYLGKYAGKDGGVFVVGRSLLRGDQLAFAMS